MWVGAPAPPPQSTPRGLNGAVGRGTRMGTEMGTPAGCRVLAAASPLRERKRVGVEGKGTGQGSVVPPTNGPLPSSSRTASDSELSSEALSSAGQGTAVAPGAGTGGWHQLQPLGLAAAPRSHGPAPRRHPARPHGPPLPSRARLSRHAWGRWRDRPGRLSRAVALGAAPSPAQAAAGTRCGRRVGVCSRGPWGSTAGCSPWGVLGCSREGASTTDEGLGRVHKGAVVGGGVLG